MKVVALEGSPRPKSFTDKLLAAFIEGMGSAAEAVTFKLSQMKIHHCIGCWTCWTKTPGVCAFHDDMEHIYPHLEEADLIIFASPVYVDGFTGLIKCAIDRMICLVEPFMSVDAEGHSRHRRLKQKEQKLFLISTCGFAEADNFDPIRTHFRAICKNHWARNAGEIVISAAGMSDAPGFFDEKIELVKKSGKILAESGAILQEVLDEISKEVIDRQEYRDITNAFFRGGF